jgi:sugar phosphate isomerase/epimerase
MIRSPVGFRINLKPDRAIKDQIREAARLGAKGVVLDALGELSPDRLGETGRRELRHVLRSVELSLIALSLPTRRPFDTEDQLDERLTRADRAFAMTYDLGGRLVLVQAGAFPDDASSLRREVFLRALRELARQADHRGVRLALETGFDPGTRVRSELEALGAPSLASSIDPAALLRFGHDPIAATRDLGPWVAHAYANEATSPAGRAVVANPFGSGFRPGALDWAEYLGALEEIDYGGFLTIWPDPSVDQGAAFNEFASVLKRF